MHEFKIISGEFDSKEAKEILLHIVENKIRFHNLKIFSTEERFGKTDHTSVNRLIELTNLRKELLLLLNEAKDSDKRLKIAATINIEVVEEGAED